MKSVSWLFLLHSPRLDRRRFERLAPRSAKNQEDLMQVSLNAARRSSFFVTRELPLRGPGAGGMRTQLLQDASIYVHRLNPFISFAASFQIQELLLESSCSSAVSAAGNWIQKEWRTKDSSTIFTTSGALLLMHLLTGQGECGSVPRGDPYDTNPSR